MYIYRIYRKGIEMKNKTPKNNLTKKSRVPTPASMIKFFMIFFIASLFVSAVLAAASGGESWKYMLFHSGKYTDMYMDFFNSIRDGGSPDVYSARNNIYPPLCVLIFRILSKLIDPDLVSTFFSKRKLLQSDQISMVIYMLFALICIMSLMRLIESYANIKSQGKLKTQAAIISFAMIISYPVMFCLERGNILILSVIFAMFFIFFKDSKYPIIKELSYIALALSAGIKLYPAIFGLSLIIEKKYKEAGRLILYGIIAVVFPIVFFLDEFRVNPASVSFGIFPLLNAGTSILADAESTSAFEKLIKNLINFAVNKKSSLNFSSVSVQNFIFMARGSTTVAKIVCLITEIIAVFCAFKTKREWQRVFLLAYLMLNIPSASNSYALSFLLIPFTIFLFAPQKYRIKDWIYLGCFALLLTPLPTLWFYHPEIVQNFVNSIGVYYNTQLNQYLGTITVQFMFLLISIECISGLFTRKEKKTAINNKSDKTDEQPDGEESVA